RLLRTAGARVLRTAAHLLCAARDGLLSRAGLRGAAGLRPASPAIRAAELLLATGARLLQRPRRLIAWRNDEHEAALQTPAPGDKGLQQNRREPPPRRSPLAGTGTATRRTDPRCRDATLSRARLRCDQHRSGRAARADLQTYLLSPLHGQGRPLQRGRPSHHRAPASPCRG